MALTRRHLETLGHNCFSKICFGSQPGTIPNLDVSGQRSLLLKYWHTVWLVILEPQLYYAEHWYVAYKYCAPVTLLAGVDIMILNLSYDTMVNVQFVGRKHDGSWYWTRTGYLLLVLARAIPGRLKTAQVQSRRVGQVGRTAFWYYLKCYIELAGCTPGRAHE